MNRAIAVLLAFGLFGAQVCFGQGPTAGTPPFGSFGGGSFDTINLGNLNVHFVVPLVNKPGRGMPFSYNLTYDGSVWYPLTDPNSGTTTWTPVFNWGWIAQTAVPTGYVSYYFSHPNCPDDNTHQYWRWNNFSYVDSGGTAHRLGGMLLYDPNGTCGLSDIFSTSGASTDGSDLQFAASITSDGLHLNQSTITARNGYTYNPPYYAGGAATVTDSNLNQISISTSGVFTDTLGMTALSISGSAPSPTKFTYTAPTGSTYYQMNYVKYTVQTAFGIGGIAEYAGAVAYLVDNIQVPDGSQYKFTYEKTPGSCTPISGTYSGYCVTARIASLTLPTGGQISYSYSGSNHGIESDGSTAGLSRTTPDSSTPWTYSRSLSGSTWVTTVVDPAGNNTVMNFAEDGSTNPTYNFYETQRKVYQGAATGTPLETVVTCYNGTSLANCPTAAVSSPITEVNAYSQFNGGSQAHVDSLYNSNGLPTETDAYDFGGSSLRRTFITYANIGNGIVDRPACVQTTAASKPSSCPAITSDTVAATTYGNYDANGNVKTVSGWVSGSKWLSRSFTYTTGGLIQTATDVNGAQTTYSYAANNNCPANSFPSSVAEPLSLSYSMTWDCSGGVLNSYTDVNGNTTTYSYTANGADPLYRLKEVIPPIESPITYTYHTGSLPSYTATTQLVWGSYYAYHQVNLDGLGRPVATTDSDPNSPVNYRYTITKYNTLGQVASVTNPYFCDGTNCSPADATYGSTTYNYDALGRVADVGSTTAITLPDGNTNHIVYTNRAKLVTDGAGIQRAYQADGLGRLQYVCDGIGAVAQANNASPSTCSGVDGSPSGFLATYGYDALNNLASAKVGAYSGYSGQTRSFTYDGLSRTLTSTNPESGTVTNVYDTGSVGDLFTTTFPKPNASTGTVTACYGAWSGSSCTSSGWDAMHRLTYVSFSDGSNSTGYGYDSNNVWGTPVNNPKGRMVLANHATQGAALFSYDTGGRLINTWQCTPINCGTSSYPLSYTYNYVNQPQTTTDAAGNTFTKAYNAAREVTSVQSSKTGTNYPQYLLNNISYNAFGEVVSATYGDGIVRTNTYDKMGRPTEIQDGPTNSPTYRLYVSYYGNGNVKTFNDTVSGGYTFTYDAFNRLVSSTNTAQSYSWTYDQFGNRWHQDKTAGTGYTVDLSFDSNNRINTGGYSYDVAGNLLKDGSACNPCWQYDDNGNLVSSAYGSSAASYSYDALGRRVERVYGGTTYDFVLDGSNSLDEYQGSVWPTVWSRTTGGAFTYANGTTYFNRTDNLGTPRVSTDYTGAVKRTETMGPFGDGFTESFAGLDFTGFAGGVWDQENNGDHFGAREYAKTQGRWLTPDPAGLAAVDPSNPQTWNRYAYVTNNPVSFTDPTGLVRTPWGIFGGNVSFLGTSNGFDLFFGSGLCGGGECWSARGAVNGLAFTLTWPGSGLNVNYMTAWITGRTPPNTQYKLVRTYDCFSPGDGVRRSTYDLQGPDATNAVITEHQLNPTMTSDNSGQSSGTAGIFDDRIGPSGTFGEKGSIRYFTGFVNGQNVGVIPVVYGNGSTYAYEGIWFSGDPRNPSNTQVFVNGSQADTMLTQGSCNQ